METGSRRPKERDGAISALYAAIEALNHSEKTSGIAPAKDVFASVRTLLTMIRDSFVDELDYVELGLFCAKICRALDRGVNGKKPDGLSQSVYDVIDLLTSTMAEIQKKLVKWGKRNVVSRRFHAKNDKETIATWNLDLDKILQVLNKESAMDINATVSALRRGVSTIVSDSHCDVSKNPEDTRGQNLTAHASAPGESLPPLLGSTHETASDIRRDAVKAHTIVSKLERNATTTQIMVSEIHRTVVKAQEADGGKDPSTQTSILGESPPPPPRTFFGRDELIEKIVSLAENFTPIALIGAGGIGKTSIALAVLHHDRIKRRFGNARRFVRCDQFPTSRAHLLRRLSNVIGAGIENPEDLTPLRMFLSSRKMLIVVDNAESILDPRGTEAQEIYAVVEELSRFDNACICITSRISTTPPDYKHLDVPTLSVDAALDTFYRIYDSNDRPNLVDSILGQLDFHPLSITLLATVAHQNRWDTDRLVREWEKRRTSVLKTRHSNSLAATIELSLASPTFQELGPNARELLCIIAFFSQGVNEDNVDWLFPTISNGTEILDGFCILSLTYRSNGFVTMLAPLRDHLRPQDPNSSSLLCGTKECYFTRMSVTIDPDNSTYRESQWIRSEDINVEHLLDVFTTIDANSDDVWDTCANFMSHLYWHEPRPTILKPKIEGLSDDHRSKPYCLFELSRLFDSVGDQVERKRLLTQTLKLWRGQGNDRRVAQTLRHLSDTNRLLDLSKEGIQQAKEAFGIYERLSGPWEQAQCLITLSLLLHRDQQLDAAEEAAFRAISLVSDKGHQSLVCRSHGALGKTYQSKGETEKAIHHYELALGIASPFNWHDQLFWVHCRLAELFYNEGRFDDVHTHLEHAKSHAVNSAHDLGYATELQAQVWHEQRRFEEARSEALRAIDIYETLGVVKDVERCRELLRDIQNSRGAE